MTDLGPLCILFYALTVEEEKPSRVNVYAVLVGFELAHEAV